MGKRDDNKKTPGDAETAGGGSPPVPLTGRPRKFVPVELSDYPEPPPADFVVEGLIPAGETSTLYADSGSGKTTVASHLGLCIVQGVPFLGRPTTEGTVLFVDWELNRARTLERLYRLSRGMGLAKIPKRFMYVSLHPPLGTLIEDVVEWCDANKPTLVMLDSYVGASGADPMSQQAAVDLMGHLIKLPTARLLIDHQANPMPGVPYESKRAFGSAYKQHLARSVMQLEQNLNSPAGRAQVTLRHTKHNFGPKVPAMAFDMVFEERAIRLEGTTRTVSMVAPLPALRRIEAYLDDHGSTALDVLMEELGISEKTVYNKISELRGMGRVSKDTKHDSEGRLVYELAT